MGKRRWDNEMKTRAKHPRIVQLTGELRQRRLRVIAVSPGELYGSAMHRNFRCIVEIKIRQSIIEHINACKYTNIVFELYRRN